ncbi:hypothetical protein M0R19_05035 [Candidatus Pacearchaeota archaeon]|jgi:hypothetical protein|nr:hypothetical protein [Candidatus Pacearchaeota archaeon]
MFTLYKRTFVFYPEKRETFKVESSEDFWMLAEKMEKLNNKSDEFFYFIIEEDKVNEETLPAEVVEKLAEVKKVEERNHKNGKITEAWLNNMIGEVKYQVMNVIMKKKFDMIKINNEIFVVKTNHRGIERNKKMKMETLIRDYRLLSA